jgi:alcohol dehydrogenase (NADP+)
MSSTQTDRKFEGWAAMDENSIKGEMKWTEYEPKPFADDDVESKFLLTQLVQC